VIVPSSIASASDARNDEWVRTILT
jgi:hypothetical protein